MKLILAQVIHHAHTGIVAMSLVGWMLPTPEQLKAYVFCMIAIMIQWALFDNKCVLTIWEDKLRGKTAHAGSESFIGQLFQRFTGRRPSEKTVDRLSYSIGCACVVGALIRINSMNG